jgi:hypothetical protein
MRGIYNGEIKDRPHVFSIFFFCFMICFPLIFFYSGFKQVTHAPSTYWYHNDGRDHAVQGLIIMGVGFLLLWLFLLLIGREFVFLTINKNKIIIRRPLLRFSPFKKDKSRVEIPIVEVAEINIYTKHAYRRPSRWWRIISPSGKEILKFIFDPEFIGNTVELEDYFKQNGINIRVNRQEPTGRNQ